MAPLDDLETRTAVIAATGLLAALQGGCQYRWEHGQNEPRRTLAGRRVFGSADGVQYVKQRASAPPGSSSATWKQMARLLIEAAHSPILEEVSRQRG